MTLFFGVPGAAGSSTFTLPSGVPSGLPLYAISLQFGSLSLGSAFVSSSAPEHFVTP